jgi:hypothetical protein
MQGFRVPPWGNDWLIVIRGLPQSLCELLDVPVDIDVGRRFDAEEMEAEGRDVRVVSHAPLIR